MGNYLEDIKEETSECPEFSIVASVIEKSFTPIPCDRCQRCGCIYDTEIHTVFRQYNYYFLGKDYWALGTVKQ